MLEDGVAVVYQHPALAPDLTVLENLQLVAPALAAPAAPPRPSGCSRASPPPNCGCR